MFEFDSLFYKSFHFTIEVHCITKGISLVIYIEISQKTKRFDHNPDARTIMTGPFKIFLFSSHFIATISATIMCAICGFVLRFVW